MMSQSANLLSIVLLLSLVSRSDGIQQLAEGIELVEEFDSDAPACAGLVDDAFEVDSLTSVSLVTHSSVFLEDSESEEEDAEDQSSIYIIPLRKQHVPVFKDGQMLGNKTSYFGTFRVGGAGETFTGVFDTGSGHVVVPSTKCSNDACLKHKRYDRSLSATSKAIVTEGKIRDGISATVTFGTGQITSEFVNDVVCLGPKGTRCARLNIFAAKKMTDDPFNLFDFDGVFGLGLDSLALSQSFHFLQQLSSQRPQMKNQFAIFMANEDDDGSQISFGGMDESKSLSPVQWAPVSRQEMGYWQVAIKSVRVGNETLEFCNDGACHGIVDSGSSMFGVPQAEVKKLHKMTARAVPAEFQQMPASEIDCRDVPGPTLTFDLGDFEVELGPKELGKPAPWNVTYSDPESPTGSASKMWCRNLYLPVTLEAPVGPNVFIFGEPFIRKYYSVFDAAEKRIGFSLANQNGAETNAIGGEASSEVNSKVLL